MKCFYHNDLDGKCAGHWVHLSAGITGNPSLDEIQFISMDYKTKFPIETIKSNEQIYIVDYSISPEEMLQLLKITSDVTWIDHHKTAIEKYKGFPYEIRGVRYDGVAGCMLTYCYLHHMTDRGQGEIKPFDIFMRNDAPYFTRLVADWDVWKFDYGDVTRYFKTGCDALDLEPTSSNWLDLYDSYNYYNVIQDGETMIKFRDNWAKDYMNLGFEIEFEGYKCFAVNLGHCNSEYFKSLPEDKYDIFMPFVFNGKVYTVSMYSKNVDVSEIAKKHGGGGHKGASGFTCVQLPFMQN